MLRLAIVEDEDRQADALADLIARYSVSSGTEISTERFKNGLSFLEAYRGGFDAVLLDIAMPVMDGMECARLLRRRDESVPIIFITTMAQYAIRGYEVEAMAFMLKPVQYRELSMKLDKLIRRIGARSAEPYAIQLRGETKIVGIPDIFFVEILAHDLSFHTRDGVYTTYGNLRSVEEDPRFSRFLKVSPSHLVNSAHVTDIGKDTITVAGEQVPLSRRRRRECLEQLARMMGGGPA